MFSMVTVQYSTLLQVIALKLKKKVHLDDINEPHHFATILSGMEQKVGNRLSFLFVFTLESKTSISAPMDPCFSPLQNALYVLGENF